MIVTSSTLQAVHVAIVGQCTQVKERGSQVAVDPIGESGVERNQVVFVRGTSTNQEIVAASTEQLVSANAANQDVAASIAKQPVPASSAT